MYEKHELEVIQYEANVYVVASNPPGKDGGEEEYHDW